MKTAFISAILFLLSIAANGEVKVTASRDYVDRKIASVSNIIEVAVTNLEHQIANATPGEYETISNKAMNALSRKEATSGFTEFSIYRNGVDVTDRVEQPEFSKQENGWIIHSGADIDDGLLLGYGESSTNLEWNATGIDGDDTYDVSYKAIRTMLPTIADVNRLEEEIENATPGNYETVSNRAINAAQYDDITNYTGFTEWVITPSSIIDPVTEEEHQVGIFFNDSLGSWVFIYNEEASITDNTDDDAVIVSGTIVIEYEDTYSYEVTARREKTVDLGIVKTRDVTNIVDQVVTDTNCFWQCRYGILEYIKDEDCYTGISELGGWTLFWSSDNWVLDIRGGEPELESSSHSEDTIVFDFAQSQNDYSSFGTVTFRKIIRNRNGLATLNDVSEKTEIKPIYSAHPTYSDRWKIYREYEGSTSDLTGVVPQPGFNASDGGWYVYVTLFDANSVPFVQGTSNDTNISWYAEAWSGGETANYYAERVRSDIIGYVLGDNDDKVSVSTNSIMLKPLSGKVYDFSTLSGMYLAVSNIVDALGGSITNFPAISQ